MGLTRWRFNLYIQFVHHFRDPKVSCINRLVCIGLLPIPVELYKMMTAIEKTKTRVNHMIPSLLSY